MNEKIFMSNFDRWLFATPEEKKRIGNPFINAVESGMKKWQRIKDIESDNHDCKLKEKGFCSCTK